jgi:hypothetical protein
MSKTGILLLTLCWGALAAGPAKIVLVAGKPSHGPGEHEFNAGTLLLAKCLRQNEGVDAVVVQGGCIWMGATATPSWSAIASINSAS